VPKKNQSQDYHKAAGERGGKGGTRGGRERRKKENSFGAKKADVHPKIARLTGEPKKGRRWVQV